MIIIEIIIHELSQAASAKAETEEVRNAVIVAGRESGTAFNSMLAQVHIVSDLQRYNITFSCITSLNHSFFPGFTKTHTR